MIAKKMDRSKIFRQIETVVGAAKIGLDIIDRHYAIRYIDPVWKKVYGDPAGRKCYRYFMGRGSVCPHCGVTEAFRTKKVIVKEEVLAREGNRPILVTTVPFKDENGEWLVAETNVDITQIKKAEESLRQAAEYWQRTFDASRDMIMILDRRQAIIKVNRAAREFLGLPLDTIVGNRCYRLMHGASAPIPDCPVARTIKSAEPSEGEIFLPNRGIWISVSADPILDDSGTVREIVHTVRDITARKEAEDRIRKESLFRNTIITNATEGIAVCHEISAYPYVRFTVWNDRMAAITGYTMAEINRRGWYQTVYPDPKYSRQARLRMNRMRQGDNLQDEEWVITRSDGKKRTLRISTTILESNGNTTHVLAMMDDITERKNAEEALRLSENRYRTLAESARDIIFVIGRDYRYAYMNRYGAANLRVKQAAFAGQHIGRFFPGKEAVAFKKYLGKVFRSGKHLATTEKVTLPSGEQWLDTVLCPIKNAHGDVEAVLGIARDITMHKEAEAVLSRDRRELEKLVQERSGELLKAQEELGKSKHLSELGLLAATVAHELRTPLAAIRTAAFNIDKKCTAKAIDTHIENIEKKVLESDHIIRNLLAYSRIKVPLYEDVDVCAILGECIALTKEIFRGYKVDIRHAIGCARPFIVQADHVQLREVFNNILNNAYECFHDRAGVIRIRVWKKGNYCKASFTDNGPGIRADNLKKIFEPFFTTKAKGMGLGLSVCRQIIDLHNGNLEVSSRRGKGTTVMVTLPMRRVPAPARR